MFCDALGGHHIFLTSRELSRDVLDLEFLLPFRQVLLQSLHTFFLGSIVREEHLVEAKGRRVSHGLREYCKYSRILGSLLELFEEHVVHLLLPQARMLRSKNQYHVAD